MATSSPPIMISSRSASAQASARSWTTTRVARPGLRIAAATTSSNPACASGSRPAKGSSSSRTSGASARVRARWTRRRSPPDRAPAGRNARCSAPIARNASRRGAHARRAALPTSPAPASRWPAPSGGPDQGSAAPEPHGRCGSLRRRRGPARRPGRRAACSCRRRSGPTGRPPRRRAASGRRRVRPRRRRGAPSGRGSSTGPRTAPASVRSCRRPKAQAEPSIPLLQDAEAAHQHQN